MEIHNPVNISLHRSRRRGAVVKGVEHISTIVFVNIWVGAGSSPAGSVGRGFEFAKT